MADIYADEGVSATSMKRRYNFLRMIDDCYAGKINLIITKNVSRFARNALDCVYIVRQLKALDPPIGIYFENENFNSLDSNSEYLLWALSIQAQEDSVRKSESIRWAIIERFKKGIPIIPTHNFLGYDKDVYGKIFIVEEEAKTMLFDLNSAKEMPPYCMKK